MATKSKTQSAKKSTQAQNSSMRPSENVAADNAIFSAAATYARSSRISRGSSPYSSPNPSGDTGKSPFDPRDPLAEIGERGLAFTSGQVTQEFLPALRRELGIATYTEMSSNDAILGGVIHAINQIMRKVTWSIDPSPGSSKDPSPKQLEYAEFLASVMNDMSIPWQDVLTEILSMLIYGWAYFEVVYKVRRGDDDDPRYKSKYNDGKVGLRKIAVRSQETLDRWALTDQGEILGMWQKPHPYSDFPIRPRDLDGRTRTDASGTARETPARPDLFSGDSLGQSVFIPLQKSLLFRTTVHRNSPEGRSILRSAYRSWYIKKNLEDIMVIGVERDLVGLPSMKAPPGFNPQNDPRDGVILSMVQNILTNIRNDEQAGIVIPPGWEFDLVASPGKKEFEIPELLQYYDKRMAMTVLGQFILLGMERVGSFALSKNSTDLFTISMIAWVQSIADVVNKFLVDEVLYLNAMDDLDDPPRFVAGDVKENDLNEVSNYVTRLVNVDALTPDDDLEESLRKMGRLDSVPHQTGLIRVAKQNKGQDQSRERLKAGGKVQGGASGAGSSGGSGGPNGDPVEEDDRDNKGRSRNDD